MAAIEVGKSGVGIRNDLNMSATVTSAIYLIDKWGVVPGSADNTAAIQDAIDDVSAAGGGKIVFRSGTYNHTGLTLKSKVELCGSGSAYRGAGGSRLHCTVYGGNAITVPSGQNDSAICDLLITGLSGSAGVSRGIVVAGMGCRIANSTVRFFNDEGVWLQLGSISCVVVDCFGLNLGSNRAPASFIGGLRVHGTDHYIDKCQFGMSQNYTDVTLTGPGWQQITSSNLYNAAIMLEGTDVWISNSSGENCDVGLYIAPNAARNKIVNFRGDQCWAHSAWIKGPNNLICNYEFSTISQQGNGLYSALKVEGIQNVISGVIGANFARFPTSAPVVCSPSYVIEDLVAGSQVDYRTKLSNITGPYVTKLVSGTDYLGSTFQPPAQADRTTSATPDANLTSFFVLVPSTSTTVTNFLGGVSGKKITVLAGNANSIIANNSNISIAAGANKTLANDQCVEFIYYFGKWYEIGA